MKYNPQQFKELGPRTQNMYIFKLAQKHSFEAIAKKYDLRIIDVTAAYQNGCDIYEGGN